MKKILLILAAMFAITAPANMSAFAQDDLTEELELGDLEFDAEKLAALPGISDQYVSIKHGPRFAAVQPTVWLNFNFSSCRRQQFTPSMKQVDNVLFVTVDLKNPMDCHGPSIQRKYKVQLASDYLHARVVALNPVSLKLQPQLPPRPRMCTAIAGVLFNPETSRCQGFTNGCQRADMLNAGFVAPPSGRCGRN